MQRFRTWQLFAICVLVWGTTWHAITYQLVDFSAESGVALRFALAGLAVLAFCRWRGVPLSRPLADHGALALQGVFLYGVSYVCVYHAERFVPSGLVAVGYSASPLLGGIGAALLFGASLSPRFVVGGMLGLVGVVGIFWTEITPASGNERAALGALFTVASVLLSAVGSLTASRNRRRGLALLPAMGFGMLYGASAAAIVALAFGRSNALPTVPSWWLSLAYLALAGSVLAFASFLTLQDRVGVAAAGTVGVMTPLVALVMSLALEGFRPDGLTAIGATLAVAGNALMLIPARSGRRPAPPAAQGVG